MNKPKSVFWVEPCKWEITKICNDCDKYCSIETKIRLGWTYEAIRAFYKLSNKQFHDALAKIDEEKL
jgi:hypothetical protein